MGPGAGLSWGPKLGGWAQRKGKLGFLAWPSLPEVTTTLLVLSVLSDPSAPPVVREKCLGSLSPPAQRSWRAQEEDSQRNWSRGPVSTECTGGAGCLGTLPGAPNSREKPRESSGLSQRERAGQGDLQAESLGPGGAALPSSAARQATRSPRCGFKSWPRC